MKYTAEQIKSILENAPSGSQFYTDGYDIKYRKVIGDKYFGYLGEATGWVETCDKQLSQDRINKGWWLPNLLKELENQMNIDKVETQTEHQEAMSAFSGEVEWNGEGLPPVGALCKVNRDSFVYRVMYSSDFVVIVQNLDNDNTTAHGMDIILDLYKGDYTFSKPETQKQREDRERDESAKQIIIDLCGDDAFKDRDWDYHKKFTHSANTAFKLVDLGYRKGVK